MRVLPWMSMVAMVMAAGSPAPAAGAPRPSYEAQNWPAARQLVWAKPGVGGDFAEPRNWLDKGRPAEAAPDRQTDVVLPAADKAYQVRAGNRDALRHAAVERNALLVGRHRAEIEVWGNLDIRKGGAVAFVAVRGPNHTFVRNADADFPDGEDGTKYYHVKEGIKSDRSRSQVSHKFQVCKYGDGSVEFIGRFGVSDEIMVQSGRMIVSGELRWSGVTDKGALEVYDGATLELQSGAVIGPFQGVNRKRIFNLDVYRNGTLQAGSPSRPLTADARLLLGYGDAERAGETGLFAAAGSQIRVFSADPARARLVISSITGHPGWRDGRGKPVAGPDVPAQGTKGIALQLAGDVQLDGALFDYVAEGGLRLADPSVRERWTHVAFGDHNAGPPERLFGRLSVDADTYYHNRADGASEFGLTVAAVKSMEDYLRQHDRWKIASAPEPVRVMSVGGLSKPMPVEFRAPLKVTLGCALPQAELRYTTDGSDPTRASALYAAPIELRATTRLKVKAFLRGSDECSDTFLATYILK